MTLLSLVYPAIILGFSILALRTILFWSAYIQRKQYRLDRLWQAFVSGEANHLLFNPYRLGLLFFFVALEVGLRFWSDRPVFNWLLIGLSVYWLLWSAQTILRLIRKQLDLPTRTPKIIAFVLFVICLDALIAWNYGLWVEILLAIEIVAPLWISLLFALASLPNFISQKVAIAQATRQRQRFPEMRAIGITGSYGKTTTKEYIAHLLASKYRVLKTPEHVNVDTGVAHVIKTQLTQPYDFFVVEMGAYRLGEIASICRLVKPTFAVLTALGDQHVELFGSQEKLERAKFELIEAVSVASRCYANAQSPRLVQAMARREIKPVWYGVEAPAAPVPTKIQYSERGTTFVLEGVDFSITCFGSANLVNALGAIALCHDIGMTYAEIATAAQTLPKIEHTFQILSSPSGAMVLDSTYNASVDGVESAIQDLSLVNRDHRALVFRQVIELGDASIAEHRRLARAMAHHLDTVVLLDSPWRQAMVDELFKEGFPAANILEAKDFNDLSKKADAGYLIFFAGRDALPFLNQSLGL